MQQQENKSNQPRQLLINSFSRGWDESFVLAAERGKIDIHLVCTSKQQIPAAKYNTCIECREDESYAHRDQRMVDTSKKIGKTLLVAFVRKDYNRHKTGANTLQTIQYFKGQHGGKKKKNLDKSYIPGLDNDVYLISEDPEEMRVPATLGLLASQHASNILELIAQNNYTCVLTSGPVSDQVVTDFAQVLAAQLFL
jgi:hypothetical protein